MKRGIYTKIGFFWKTEKENEWECQIGEYSFLIIEKGFNFRCTVFYDSVFVFSEDSHTLTLAKNRCRNQYEKHKRTLLKEKVNSKMMAQIKMTCEGCNHIHDLNRTPEIPAHVFAMRCNWCPNCEHQADDDYEEWYEENEGGDKEPILPVPDNQLCMPFIFDELEIPKQQYQTT